MGLLKLEERKGKDEQFMLEMLEETAADVKAGKIMQLVIIADKEHEARTNVVHIRRCCKSVFEMLGLVSHALHTLVEGR